MDRRMLDLGGEANRRQLMAKVATALGTTAAAVENAGAAAAQQDYTAEDAKIQEIGDTGQGNRLTDAKKAA